MTPHEQQLADAFEREEAAAQASRRAKFGLRRRVAVAQALMAEEAQALGISERVCMATEAMWSCDCGRLSCAECIPHALAPPL